jgi:recombination protein RecA
VSALDDALRDVERTFGKGSAYRYGRAEPQRVDVVPTGAINLDLALGVGGFPRGRIVEVFGPESSGKTTLLLHTIANAQALGLEVAFLDAEHALDVGYARALGVDVDRMILSQPDTAEQALEIGRRLVKSGELGVLVVDSVAALTPRAELDGEIGDQTVGLLARLMSQTMRVLAGDLRKTNTLAIFTNQIREKIGVMFGSPETQPGGRALKFYASQRLRVSRTTAVGPKGEQTHSPTKVVVQKNKVAAPFREAEFDVEFGTGISTAGVLLDVGTELGVVTKSGGKHTFGKGANETVIGMSRDKAKAALNEDPELMARLDGAVRSACGLALPG